MKNKVLKRYKSLALTLSLSLALTSVASPAALTAYADTVNDEEEAEESGQQQIVVSIKNVSDFISLADDCRKQTYSTGLIFELENDINFAGYENITIPFMDGTFRGNNHTISGIVLNEETSDYGFFRYVGENGSIENLIVSGEVVGGDEQNHVGILAGSNLGKISKCTVQGSLNANSVVGAIAGENAETGVISECVNEADVDGKFQTGGITGHNKGIVIDSENKGRINTSAKVVKQVSDSDGQAVNISIPNAVTGLAADDRANETGGVVGSNEGQVKYCDNEGLVGHDGLGNIVGGICGYSKGLIENSDNKAIIYGRKNVGGICGYLDPYEAESYDKDYFKILRDQLDDLSDIADSLSDSGDILSDDLSMNSDLISSQVTDLKNTLRSYADAYDYDIDSSRGKIKSQADDLENTVNEIELDFEVKKLSKANAQLYKDILIMQEKMEQVELLTPGLSAEDYSKIAVLMKKYKQDTTKLLAIYTEIYKIIASGRISALGGGISLDDDDDDEDGYVIDVPSEENISAEEADGNTEADDEVSNPENTENSENEADTPSDDNGDNGDNKESETPADTPAETPAADPEPENVQNENNGVVDQGQVGLHNARTHASAPDEAAAEDVPSEGAPDPATAAATQQVMKLMGEIDAANVDAQKQIAKIQDYFDELPGDTKELRHELRDVRSELEDIYHSSDELLSKLDSRTDAFKIDVRPQGDALQNTMDKTSDDLDSDLDRVSSQIRKLKNKIDDIRYTVSDGFDEFRDRLEDKNPYVDISEAADFEEGDGKILFCKNAGEIIADSQAGGIVGSIDKESTSDTALNAFQNVLSDDADEDDDEENEERNDSFTKHVQAVVFSCKNTSDVTADSGYCGGVAGKASYGVLASCQNFGDVSSDDGKYVGGIAGYSDLTIIDTYALGGVSGTSFIGGIAGRGRNVYDSYVCTYMDMDDTYVKSSGAVAGKAKGTVSGNYYVDNGYGAVDGVTKTNEAYSVSYKEMLSIGQMPDEFKTFTIKFIDEDETIWEKNFKYGDVLEKDNYPDIEKEEGQYAYWEDKQVSPICRNVTIHSVRRVYVPSVQAKTSDNSTDQPDIVLGGNFFPDTTLSVRNVTDKENEAITNIKKDMISDIHYVIMNAYRYDLSQEEDIEGEIQLRVRNTAVPSNRLILLDDELKPVSTVITAEHVGSYLSTVGAINPTGYIVVISYVSNKTVAAGVVLLIIILVALVVTTIVIHNFRKKRKNRLENSEDSEEPEAEPEDESEDEQEAELEAEEED